MNLSLQDPFAVAQEYPETLTRTLNTGHLVVIQFSHNGDYLASGLVDGLIMIYDLSSGGVVVHIKQKLHIRPVTLLSWSPCGRYLLLTSQDWTCKLWDLLYVNKPHMSALIHTVRLDGPIWMGALNPRCHREFVAAVYEDDPVYVKLETEIRDKSGENKAIDGENHSQHDNEENKPVPFKPHLTRLQTRPLGEETDQGSKNNSKHLTLTTVFWGNYILAGTLKGWLNVIDLELLKSVRSVKVANGNIKNVVMLPVGRKLAVNASDRIIRQLLLPGEQDDIESWPFEVEHRYQDVVNRLQWNSVAFNHNGEFLVALTYGQLLQDLYVWETSLGSLVKILEGSNEELIDVKWNYPKCIIGSTGIDSGYVYLWLVQFPQKWSALAPDFVEIEENIEYDEKEDEFDVMDDEEVKERLEQEEDVDADILTKEEFDARGFRIGEGFVIPVKYY